MGGSGSEVELNQSSRNLLVKGWFINSSVDHFSFIRERIKWNSYYLSHFPTDKLKQRWRLCEWFWLCLRVLAEWGWGWGGVQVGLRLTSSLLAGCFSPRGRLFSSLAQRCCQGLQKPWGDLFKIPGLGNCRIGARALTRTVWWSAAECHSVSVLVRRFHDTKIMEL